MFYKRLLGVYNDEGQSKPCIYSLHPIVKLLFAFLFVLSTGLVQSGYGYIVLAGLLFLTYKIAEFPLFTPLKILKPFKILLIFTFIIQLFITTDGRFISPSESSFINASMMTVRMALMIGFSSIFAFITPPTDIVRVFYLLFTPLKLVKISPADVALSMMIALRFIPLLFSEGEKITDSQRLKGIIPIKGEKKSKTALIKSSMSLVIPLFIRTFHYASQISITLKYRRRDENFFKTDKIKVIDIFALLCFTLLSVGTTLLFR